MSAVPHITERNIQSQVEHRYSLTEKGQWKIKSNVFVGVDNMYDTAGHLFMRFVGWPTNKRTRTSDSNFKFK